MSPAKSTFCFVQGQRRQGQPLKIQPKEPVQSFLALNAKPGTHNRKCWSHYVVPCKKIDGVVHFGLAMNVKKGYALCSKWIDWLHNYSSLILHLHYNILVSRVNAPEVCNRLVGPEVICVIQSALVRVYPRFFSRKGASTLASSTSSLSAAAAGLVQISGVND